MSGRPRFTRRSFLKKSTSIAITAIGFPYIIPSSSLGKAGSVAPSNRITIGSIGTGEMGIRDLRNFLSRDQVQVVAVCDVNRGSYGYWDWDYGPGKALGGREPARKIVEEHYAGRKQTGRYKGCASYNDFRQLLARDDVDAVVIAVPDHWHGVISVMAAQAGKDIYGEKPLAHTIADGQAICDAVKKYGIVWQTGSHQRSESQFHRACELVRNGRIGEVRTVRVGLPKGRGGGIAKPAPVPDGFDYDMWLGPAPWAAYSPDRCLTTFRWISDYANGEIGDWAGHHCDIAQWGMGTEYTGPVEIEGNGIWPRDGFYDTAISYRFVCKYAEGFTMIVSDSQQHPKSKDGIRFADIYSEGPTRGSGTAIGNASGRGVLFEGTEGWVNVSRAGLDVHPKSLLTSAIGPNEIHLYKSNDHVGNFIDCLKSRSLTIVPPEVAQRSMSIGELGIIAMKMERKLKWNPEKERFINDPEANRFLWRPMRSPWHL